MVITSRQNATVREFRDPGKNFFAVEGAKLIAEALDAGLVPELALFTEKAAEKRAELFGRMPCPVSVIKPDIGEYISDTKTPQGAFALFRRPDSAVDFAACSRLLLLDGVRDPGNVGAIARSCEAFGFGGIILSDTGADLFGKKVIRAAAGSAFRLPSARSELVSVIPRLKQFGFAVYAADIDKGATPINEAVFAEKSAVVIGSEGEGLSRAVAELCDKKIYIPIKGAESLNAAVAAGIICYAAGVTINN